MIFGKDTIHPNAKNSLTMINTASVLLISLGPSVDYRVYILFGFCLTLTTIGKVQTVRVYVTQIWWGRDLWAETETAFHLPPSFRSNNQLNEADKGPGEHKSCICCSYSPTLPQCHPRSPPPQPPPPQCCVTKTQNSHFWLTIATAPHKCPQLDWKIFTPSFLFLVVWRVSSMGLPFKDDCFVMQSKL